MSGGKGTTYFYAIFSITLVLFVLGMAAIITIEANRISKEFKETLMVEIVLKDNVTNDMIGPLQARLQTKKYIKNIRYISKEEAAKILQKDLGENFLDILGYNPLYGSFNLNLVGSYANKDSFDIISRDLTSFPEVKQVNIQTNILESLDKKARSASFIVFFIAVALLVFAISLIFNTIRLAMFANRFTIKTMQLFGATRWFIIRPFLGKGLLNGLVSGIVACLLIEGLIFYFDHSYPEIGLLRDFFTFALLFGCIILFGILISFISTLMAVLHYLRLKVEDLY